MKRLISGYFSGLATYWMMLFMLRHELSLDSSVIIQYLFYMLSLSWVNTTPSRTSYVYTFGDLSTAYYALWIVLRIAYRGTEEAAAQQQQHSSSSTAAVVAATSRLRTKRTSLDAPVSLLFSFLRFGAIWKGRPRTHREVFSNHYCFTVALNTQRLHTR